MRPRGFVSGCGDRGGPSRWLSIALTLSLAAGALVTIAAADAGSVERYTGVSSRLHSLTSITPTAPEHRDHPGLALVSAMVPWRALEPQDDSFHWRTMDANVADARRRGYRLIVRVMAGRASPGWLAGAGAATLRLLGTDPNAADHCRWITTPVPWDEVLATEYEELMGALGGWLEQPDGFGGRNADHVYLVPISMPSVLGSEMTIGYGSNEPCPPGTGRAGTTLAATNRAAWDTVSSEAQRRRWIEAVWRRAIAIHMRQLPTATNSVIAYGALFGDGQAASRRIARNDVARYRPRLWSMYTNLQPSVRADGSLGPWSERCRPCHRVILTAIRHGGAVGFQAAGAAVNDTAGSFRTAIEAALRRYEPSFLEAGSQRIDRFEPYLLTGERALQARIARAADRCLGSTPTWCRALTADRKGGIPWHIAMAHGGRCRAYPSRSDVS
jgi:hypothetical protein